MAARISGKAAFNAASSLTSRRITVNGCPFVFASTITVRNYSGGFLSFGEERPTVEGSAKVFEDWQPLLA